MSDVEIRERMAELLRGVIHARVAEALGVSRTTVGRWAKGRNTSYRQLLSVAAAVGKPIREPSDTPPWAERLMAMVEAIAERVGVSEAERKAIQQAGIGAVEDTLGPPLPDRDGEPTDPTGGETADPPPHSAPPDR